MSKHQLALLDYYRQVRVQSKARLDLQQIVKFLKFKIQSELDLHVERSLGYNYYQDLLIEVMTIKEDSEISKLLLQEANLTAIVG